MRSIYFIREGDEPLNISESSVQLAIPGRNENNEVTMDNSIITTCTTCSVNVDYVYKVAKRVASARLP